MPANVEQALPVKSQLRCRARGELAQWLAESGGSLAVTTYTSGTLVLISSFGGRLHFCTHRFVRPMGIAIAADKLALAVRRQILLFQRDRANHDAFLLRRTFETGKVDAHDVAFGERGIYFANTRYNALARASRKCHFLHCWQPPFIEGIVQDDRCHLNGLGMREGKPKMVTAFCATGHAGGWRAQDRFAGGVVIDVNSGEVVADGLCMPHSPRWHAGRWWFCNSGQGLLVSMDPHSANCTDVCALPGFARGLCLVGDHALVGLSKIRRKHILDAPPVGKRYKQIIAGVALVDLASGRHKGCLEFLHGGNEVYDVLFLPAIVKPSIALAKLAPAH